MKSLNFKKKNLKKILCLFIILFNFHIIFDKLINKSYEKSSKIEDSLIIRNSNGNATQFKNITYDNEVIWGTNITFSLNFTYTEDNGITWDPVLDPNAYCNITISDIGLTTDLIKTNMTPLGNGIFFKAINSSRLSAGGTYKLYYVVIEGSSPGYPDPNPEIMILRINAIPTKISAYNYSTLEELPDKTYTAYYNELINITVKYCNNESGTPLNNAHLTYQWLGLTPIDIFVDPINKGFYTFTINTSDAQSTGLKIINVIASFENYTTQSNFLIYLNILERKTDLNGQSELVYLNPKVWVQDAHDFMFTYSDANTLETIGDLTIATYIWQELYENGSIIPGRDGSGTLIQYENKTYALDFNTEHQQVGFYYLYVTLQKENYETKSALINLEIIPRPTLINGTTSILTISKDIEFRTAYNFTFEINNTLTHSRIGDLDQAFYYWYRTESNGTILEGPSQNIDLVKDLNDLYILDFNSELKSIGFYRIHVEFHKENYSSRYAIINFTISPPLKININSPSPNDVFGIIAPDFELDIIGSFDAIWYTIDNGDTNITISALSGTINQIEWDKRENDIILIKFYANNSNGFVGYALVQVIKFTISLKININSPSPNDVFGIIAPDFELDIIGSFDAIWYTIDNGDTNITISALSGTINQIEWDKRENDIILIKFYANNSNGFVGYALVQVIKFVSEQPSPKVFGYDLMILLGVISIITLTIKKKIFERGLKKESKNLCK